MKKYVKVLLVCLLVVLLAATALYADDGTPVVKVKVTNKTDAKVFIALAARTTITRTAQRAGGASTPARQRRSRPMNTARSTPFSITPRPRAASASGPESPAGRITPSGFTPQRRSTSPRTGRSTAGKESIFGIYRSRTT